MIGAIFSHLQRMSDAQQTGTLPTWLNRAAVIVVWLLCISAYISKKVPIFVIKKVIVAGQGSVDAERIWTND